MPKLLMATWIAVPLFFAACASVQRPPHRDLMHAAAAECQAKYQSDVERYEFDRFGRVIAYAGEFSTVKVVVRNKWNNSIAWEYWYSPTARQFVRVRDHLSYGIETRVLAAFKLD